jgi:tetratricopeptide (TPR) repeat protein
LPTNTAALRPSATLSPNPTEAVTTQAVVRPDFLSGVWATVTPIATPMRDADHFALNVWTAQDALDLVARMEQYALDNNWMFPVNVHAGFTAAQPAVRVAAQEAMLRFDGPDFEDAMRWRIARSDAYNFSSASDEWMLAALAAELNSSGQAISALPGLAQAHDLKVVQIEEAANLFGRGRSGWVVWLSTQYGYGDGIYFAAGKDEAGALVFHKLRGRWNINHGSDWEFEIADHTRDGISDLTILAGLHSGTLCSYRFDVYQWETDHFRNLTTGPSNPFGVSAHFCDTGPSFQPADASGLEAILTGHWAPGRISPSGLDWVRFQYGWQGKEYALNEVSVREPTGAADLAGAWLDYALESGRYEAVANRLQAIISAWPRQPEAQSLGAAYPDFARFQLAWTYALMNMPEQARPELQHIIEQPASPSDGVVADAAQAFLSNYAREGDAYRACDAALQVMRVALGPQLREAVYIDDEHYEAAWGFVPDSPHGELCSPRGAFYYHANLLGTTEAGDVIGRLRQAGFSLSAAQQSDLDLDGRADWVIVVATPNASRPHMAWVLMNTSTGWRTLPAVPWESNDYLDWQPPSLQAPTIELLSLPGTNQPVVGLLIEDELRFIRATELSGEPHLVQTSERIIDVRRYAIETQSGVTRLRTTSSRQADCEACGEVHEWDAANLAFYYVDRELAADQQAAAEAAEAVLFDTGDAARARALYEAALSISDEFLRPRILYGLALAAELDGDTAQAVTGYWQVWHEHPDSPFGVMAETKISLRD